MIDRTRRKDVDIDVGNSVAAVSQDKVKLSCQRWRSTLSSKDCISILDAAASDADDDIRW